MMITREQMLKPIKLKAKTVPIDGWGEFKIRQITKSQGAKLAQWVSPNGKTDHERVADRGLKMIVMSVIDEDGNCLLTDADMETLKGLPEVVVGDLEVEVMVFNGYLDKQAEESELLGKSESCSSAKKGCSTSDSPEN